METRGSSWDFTKEELMESTCCGDNCCFLKNGLCEKVEDCPNYTESVWRENSSGKVSVIKDCAPKRIMLSQQQIFNSFDAVTGSVQVLRDKVTSLEDLLVTLINQSKKRLNEQDLRRLEQNEKGQDDS